jgi:phosphoglycolate phosphatase
MAKKERGVIIFDFDGTIADSFLVALDIFYSFSKIKPLNKKEVQKLRGMALVQISQELKMPGYMIPFLLIRGRKAMHRRMGEVGMEPGMDRAIKQLAKTHTLFVLSSNSPENITTFLDRYQLTGHFKAIHGNAGLLRKARHLQKIIVANQLDRSQTWYVGDESRDVEAAHKCHIKSVAVTWGYNSKRALSRHKPTVQVNTAAELLRCFKNN